MTNDDFKGWRATMGYSREEAASALGLSKSTIDNYEAGFRREDKRPVKIPQTTALACSALYHKIPAWGD